MQKIGVSLLPGEKGIFNANGGSLIKNFNEDSNFIAWKSGILKFENADLQEAVLAIEEYYGVTIHLNPSLKNCKITTIFNNQPLEQVLMELQILLDIESTRKNEKIILSGKGC